MLNFSEILTLDKQILKIEETNYRRRTLKEAHNSNLWGQFNKKIIQITVICKRFNSHICLRLKKKYQISLSENNYHFPAHRQSKNPINMLIH